MRLLVEDREGRADEAALEPNSTSPVSFAFIVGGSPGVTSVTSSPIS